MMIRPLSFGVMVNMYATSDPAEVLGRVRNLGLDNCQLGVWSDNHFTSEGIQALKDAMEQTGVTVSTVWSGWPGPQKWNFVEGPTTLGLVPEEYRAERLAFLKSAVPFAKAIGAPSITTHVGFIPENMTDPVYPGLIETLRDLAGTCRSHGLGFWFETGQETPVTLLRAIHDIGLDNLGINLDPANLLMYGKANPVDALDIFGKYVRGVHVKDGEYPTDGHSLGKERPVGQGRVDFYTLIRKLYDLGYRGPLTIEREIKGDQQIQDIKHAIEYLTPIVEEILTDRAG